MGAKKPFLSVAEYLNQQPERTKKALEELRSYILEAAPAAVERINYNIPAYALVQGGKRDQQIMIAGFKSHVGFYPHPVTLEHFAKELAGFKTGKGSVQFDLQEPLPKELILKMVRFRKDLLDSTR